MFEFFKRKRERLLLLTGAGSSISFGYPSTTEITELINENFKNNDVVSRLSRIYELFEKVYSDIENYFVNPGIVTYENIYQAIQDVLALKDIPYGPEAFDEFRPHVGATHKLKEHYASYGIQECYILQDEYINTILESFLEQLHNITEVKDVEKTINNIENKFILNSFTLNYDDIIQKCLRSHVTGFKPGNSPRVFDQSLLLRAISNNYTTHCHLHGSLKWGFPTSVNPFEIHEHDTPSEGVRASFSRPSGRPSQRGDTLPVLPIVTGMDKTELVFRNPFYSNFLAFFRSLELSTHLLIVGYGFSDRHVNLGIQQCRENRPRVKTYIVDFAQYNDPSYYLDKLTPDSWRTILPGDPFHAERLSSFDGWWKLPEFNQGGVYANSLFMWLKGFDAFCEEFCNRGLPE